MLIQLKFIQFLFENLMKKLEIIYLKKLKLIIIIF